MRTYLFSFLMLFSAGIVQATHQISTELTYEYVGDSNVLIRAEHIDWCGGTIWTGGNPQIPNLLAISRQCPGTSSQMAMTLPLKSVVEIPVFSYSGQSYNSCGTSGNNGYTGYRIATYDTVVPVGFLNIGCDTVRISFTTGARITTQNLNGQPSYYTWVDIDLSNLSNLTSTKSFGYDIPGGLIDSASYNFSVARFDADGDSLTYELDTVWNLNNVPASFSSGYSYNSPMPNFSINASSGQIEYNPIIPIGYDYSPFALNIRTDEWEPGSGFFKGSTYRDIVFFVLPFPGNNNPLFLGLDNPQHAKQTDSLALRVCAGDTFSFDLTFDDPDLTDTLFVTSNLEFIADFYSVSQTGINPTTATIKAVINKEYVYGIDIIVKAMDSHNPMIGQTSRAVRIRSIGSANQTLLGCYSAWDTVMTQADSLSTWTVLNGDSLSTQTFNCLNGPCNMAEVNPFNSTTYLIENIMTGGCSVFDTLTVLTDPTVLIGQAVDTLQNPVTSSKVYRFQFDAGQDSVYVMDSTTTDAAGFFTFSLGIDSFLLKVSPDINTYPLLLPTYYDSKVTVPQADFIYPDYCDTLELTHEVQSGVNLGGPGFIAGIVSQGAGRAVGDPVPGVEIVLMGDEETPIAHTKTDENGEFRFDDLSNGDYLVYVDRWLIQNNLAPMITLTQEYNEVDDLEFILYSNRLELAKPSSVEGVEKERIEIFPNPTTGQITVMGDALFTSIRIVDILGAVNGTFQVNSDQSSINLSDLPDGVYFVEVFNGQELIKQQRVVLMK
jgi:hypothetical protein